MALNITTITSCFSRVEIVRGIAPVRPGPYYYYGYLSPSGAGPKQALSLLYCTLNKELRRLASYYARSNFYVPAHVPYGLCVCLSVCLSVTACLGIFYRIVTKRAVRSF